MSPDEVVQKLKLSRIIASIRSKAGLKRLKCA